MNGSRRLDLPPAPLMRTFAAVARRDDLAAVQLLGPRFAAIRSARSDLVNDRFLETATDDEFRAALERFYEPVARLPLHLPSILKRAGLVRFALNHLVRCSDALPARLERILAPGGPYHVCGLGPAFWSALCQALDPRLPAWLPLPLAGLRRLRLLNDEPTEPGTFYARLTETYSNLLAHRPDWTGTDADHFLACVAIMTGRDLEQAVATLAHHGATQRLRSALVEERTRRPLRRRLKEHGELLEQARQQLETGLHDGHAGKVLGALAMADPALAKTTGIDAQDQDLLLWVGRAWESDDPYELLGRWWAEDPVAVAGPSLLVAALHLRDPAMFPPWNTATRRGCEMVDETLAAVADPAERYRHFAEAVHQLRHRYQIHPYEVADVLASLDAEAPLPGEAQGPFHGFCPDSFCFFEELATDNRREWMERERERYQFAVRGPMLELCAALGERYVRPVLEQTHGWRLETRPQTRHCFSSICKNNYGRSAPYESSLWFAFYRPEVGSKRDDMQIFVRLESTGLSFGLHIGRNAKAAGEQFRRNVEKHAEALFAALNRRGALEQCRFAHTLHFPDNGLPPQSPDDLRRWASGKVLTLARRLRPDSPLPRGDELVGEIILTLERLLPALACAMTDDPTPWLRPPGSAKQTPAFTERDFRRNTHLSDDWLRRAKDLLGLKRQLILQGVPGTGKTHVARSLAHLLTQGRDDSIRLIQFHPGYSYEEFVEGIKARSVEANGRHDVTYPVEDGLLCSFAEEASRRPTEPYVLLIDEINRGNLPRIFGELLYLLEYRDQTVGLPYSRRNFRLPANLYLIGTMNAADRSVALIDQALRRRFSFLDMPPDPGVLSAWLREHPPKGGEEFAQTVVALFEGLNLRLRNEVGPQQQVGHSYFMVPDLDEDRLRVIWQHHIRPLLTDYFASHPARLADYELDRLLHSRRKKSTVV